MNIQGSLHKQFYNQKFILITSNYLKLIVIFILKGVLIIKLDAKYALLSILVLIFIFSSILIPFSNLNVDNFSPDEQIILNKSSSLPLDKQFELRGVFNENNKVRNQLYNKYKATNNTKYYQSYIDSGYTLNVFSKLAKERNLTDIEFNILIINLKANNAYYLNHTSPDDSYLIGAFSPKSPYPISNKFITPDFKSNLPFVYYKGQGWQYYPVTATFWASEYFKKGDYQSGQELLDELAPYMAIEDYEGTRYGVYNVYFEISNSSIPWASSYSQGMASGLYALAYNQTKDKRYLAQSNLLFNSFKVPQNKGGFLTQTKFGTWFLEIDFRPDHLILNGHIITMQGIYDYYQVTGDPSALKLFNEGVNSTKNILPEMDSGNWSYYALTGAEGKPAWKANKYYHGLHVEQLKWLYSKTGDPFFIEYAQKWNSYIKDNVE